MRLIILEIAPAKMIHAIIRTVRCDLVQSANFLRLRPVTPKKFAASVRLKSNFVVIIDGVCRIKISGSILIDTPGTDASGRGSRSVHITSDSIQSGDLGNDCGN